MGLIVGAQKELGKTHRETVSAGGERYFAVCASLNFGVLLIDAGGATSSASPRVRWWWRQLYRPPDGGRC